MESRPQSRDVAEDQDNLSDHGSEAFSDNETGTRNNPYTSIPNSEETAHSTSIANKNEIDHTDADSDSSFTDEENDNEVKRSEVVLEVRQRHLTLDAAIGNEDLCCELGNDLMTIPVKLTTSPSAHTDLDSLLKWRRACHNKNKPFTDPYNRVVLDDAKDISFDRERYDQIKEALTNLSQADKNRLTPEAKNQLRALQEDKRLNEICSILGKESNDLKIIDVSRIQIFSLLDEGPIRTTLSITLNLTSILWNLVGHRIATDHSIPVANDIMGVFLAIGTSVTLARLARENPYIYTGRVLLTSGVCAAFAATLSTNQFATIGIPVVAAIHCAFKARTIGGYAQSVARNTCSFFRRCLRQNRHGEENSVLLDRVQVRTQPNSGR